MTEVAKVRAVLERMKRCEPFLADAPGREIVVALTARGLEACEEYESDPYDDHPQAQGAFMCIAAILRDAGLMEGR